MFDFLKWIVERLFETVTGRRHLQVLVHLANFQGTGRACYFVNVTNLSHNREVEMTHVWFDVTPQVHALPPDRPLPKRLRPDETWETWVESDRLPSDIGDRVFIMGRVRLSTGKVIRSRKNAHVPSEGHVPGGAINRPPQ
jgi:hypothetical protein